MPASSLPPLPSSGTSMDPPRNHSIDNLLAWLSQRRDNNRKDKTFNRNIPNDAPRKKVDVDFHRANIDNTSSRIQSSLPLDIYNGLPGI